jgi:serine/threonine-protein kinase
MPTISGLADRVQEELSPRYTIRRELGRGGMATVLLAQQSAPDRLVAIKVLHTDVAAGFAPDRFLREIQLLARLQHPNILPLLDSGVAGGALYYVMPFVSGESLRERLKRDGALPIPLALRIAGESAAALGYAHRQGVVHRDVKPENILLSDEHVLIADFGIARAAAQSADERLTSTSVIIGTPAYMSPEQASGEQNLDERSDIYSLGCVVYEMITGKPAFTGISYAAVIASRFAKPAPRASSLRADVPGHVDRGIDAALAVSPDDRPRSADEFSAMLTGTAPTPRVRDVFRRRWLRRAAVAVVVLGGLLLLWRNTESRRTADNGREVTVARHTTDPTTHDLYLQGQSFLDKLNVTALRQAEDHFQAALARDSLYAPAWAGLAEAHSSLGVGNYALVRPRPEFEQARIAAVRALALDSTLAEAHAALAVVQMMYDYDWTAAGRSLDRAQRYDPGFETTYLYRSFLLCWLGRFDEATASSREAVHMNPVSNRFRQDLARDLLLSGHYDESEREARQALATDSTNGRVMMILGDVLLADGKPEAAVAELERAQRLVPATRVSAFRVAAYAAARRPRDAQALVDSLMQLSDHTFVPALDLAIAWAGLRDKNQALTWLERAYDDRTLRPFIREPVFDFLKGEPRYRALFRRLGLE